MPAVGPKVSSKATARPAASKDPNKNATSATVQSRRVPDAGVPLPPEETADRPNDGPKKRKPRKLNRGPTAPSQTNASKPADAEQDLTLNLEIETLKGRIRGLELQVEELYQKATPGLPPKQPRRRGRGKGVPPPSGSPEELVRLENEIEASQQELDQLRTKASGPNERKSTGNPVQPASGQSIDDDVEEIPRTSDPTAENKTQQRQVTVAGSYRIPLPSTVSLDDVRTIQNGINSANNVAKGLIDAHRAQKAATQQSRSPGTNTDNGVKGQSWGDWIGGYSMSIARMVNKIEAEAAVEQTPVTGSSRPSTSRPSIQHRGHSAPGTGSNPTKPATTRSSPSQRSRKSSNKTSSSGKGLNQQQVETLMA